jgi:uncharacterized glyoxalase superfamily protein PhnB
VAKVTSTFPSLSYRDAPAAIEWLVEALGFERHAVHQGEGEGEIVHAELSFEDNGMIMLGSEGIGTEGTTQAPGTSSIYLVVDDPDARYERAKAHGAEVIRELTDTDYGSRDFGVKDPEGNIWNFGTYDPFDPPAEAQG